MQDHAGAARWCRLRGGSRSFRLDRTGVAVVSTDASTELSIIAAAGASLPAIETSSRALARGGRLAYEF